MTSVYKFTAREHAEQAVGYGRFRFTHVSSFRAPDGIEDGRWDADEMVTRAAILGGEEPVLSTDPRFGGMFAFRRAGVEVPTEIVLTGGEVDHVDSCMLFCGSLSDSDDTFELMSSKFGYDAAYEITDVEEFARRIEAHILESGEHLKDFVSPQSGDDSSLDPGFAAAMQRYRDWGARQRRESFKVESGLVTYSDRVVAGSLAEMSPNPFLKPTGYSWQQEYRVLIRAFDGLDHYDIELRSLTELVRVVRR